MPYYNYLTLSIDLLRVAEGGGQLLLRVYSLSYGLLWCLWYAANNGKEDCHI